MSNTSLLGSFGGLGDSSLMFRNRIINGGMDIWQRSTSYSGLGVGYIGNAYGYLAADRWWAQAYAGTAGSGTTNISMSRQAFTLGQTAVPGEPSFFMRVNASAVGTQGGTNSIIRTAQRIEDVRTFAGQTATLSFWAKADSNRTYAVCLQQVFGTGGSPSTTTLAGQATFTVTSSWQYITLSFNIPSISGKTIGTNNDHFLMSSFVLYKQDNLEFGDTLGPIGTWSTTPYLDLVLVQMEAGPTATPFERRLIQTELALCQRYFEKSYNIGVNPGSITNAGAVSKFAADSADFYDANVQLKVTKRARPTLRIYSSGSGLEGRFYRANTGLDVTAVNNATEINENVVYFYSNGSMTANARYVFHWTADAEL